jgi:hypothetical protein
MQATGETRFGEGSGLTRRKRRRPERESDRVVVLMKPGNSGGGKGPDFWSADEEGKDQVIGNEP